MYALIYSKETENNPLLHFKFEGLVEGKMGNKGFKSINDKTIYPYIQDCFKIKDGLYAAFMINKKQLLENCLTDDPNQQITLKDSITQYMVMAINFVLIASNKKHKKKFFLCDSISDKIIPVNTETNLIKIVNEICLEEETNYNKSLLLNVKTEEEEAIQKEITFPEIYHKITNSIICQDEPIKQIVTAIRANQLFENKKLKSNILVTGPTGVGKTEVFREISELSDIPISINDSNEFSAAGFEGANVNDSIFKLFLAAGCDVEKAEKGIVLFDEIDKLASNKDDSAQISTTDVLYSLLTLMEGKKVNFVYHETEYSIDTSKMTFVALGAFSSLQESLTTKAGIGFNKSIVPSTSPTKNITIKNLVEYGMPREFLGRFNTVVQMNHLELKELKQIIQNSSNSTLLLYKEQLEEMGIEFLYDEETINYIVQKADELHLGARGLYSVTKQIVETKLFEYFSNLEEETNKKIDVRGKQLIKRRK